MNREKDAIGTSRAWAFTRRLLKGRRQKSRDEQSDAAVSSPALEMPEPVAAEPLPMVSTMIVRGHYDGLRGDDLYGWAQYAEQPDVPVTVQIYLNGTLAGEEEAVLSRPDLRAAGVGHGRYGWRFALPGDLPVGVPIPVVVRAKGGDPLGGGVFNLELDGPAEPADQARCDAFVAAALTGTDAKAIPVVRPDPAPLANFLLYSPVPLAATNFGRPEYSYAFVRQAFERLLPKLGKVHDTPDAATADRLLAEIEERGESAVLLCFAPPQRVLTGTRCPVVPVVAWEFPTVPTTSPEGSSQDWRLPLRRNGRVITLSGFAAAAIRATMGKNFPVAAIPTPVWDRYAPLFEPETPRSGAAIKVDGFVYDSRGRSYVAAGPIPPVPGPDDFPSFGDAAQLDGVVFTSVFSPHDTRKNWGPMVLAFVTALRDKSDATLVLKMITADPAVWWWELHDLLNSMPAFSCRIVVLHGYLEDAEFDRLIRASHWIVNASNAEGLCMPLVEYMSAGVPAISPAHTAMADYVTPVNALIVPSAEEPSGFPQEENTWLVTTRHRIEWDALAGALDKGYRIVRERPEEHARLCTAAHESTRAFCSEEVVAAALDSFLGLNVLSGSGGSSPSALIRATALS